MISVKSVGIFVLLTVGFAHVCAFAAEVGQRNSRRFAPGTCGPVDPTYIHLAEQTGGQPIFLQPAEMAIAGHLMRETTRNNRDALLYATSHLARQMRKFAVLIDTAVQRAIFSLSFDARGAKMILVRPSGSAVASGEGGVESSDWTCGRIVSINSQEKGNWRVQLGGNGRFWLRLTAQSDLYLLKADFLRLGGRIGHEGYFKIPGQPLADREQMLQATSSGALRSADFRLVSSEGDTIQRIAVNQEGSDPEDREFFGQLTLPHQPFRLAVNGIDAKGLPFQRIFPTQFRATTVEINPINKVEYLQASTPSILRFLVRNYGETAKFHLLAVNSRGSVIPITPSAIEIPAGGSVDVSMSVTIPETRRMEPASPSRSRWPPDIRNGISVELSVVSP